MIIIIEDDDDEEDADMISESSTSLRTGPRMGAARFSPISSLVRPRASVSPIPSLPYWFLPQHNSVPGNAL